MAGPTFENWRDVFVRTYVGIPIDVLPDDSIFLVDSYDVAVEMVNPEFSTIGIDTLYRLAVYNLAASILINTAQDVPGSTYFKDLRERWGLSKFSPGVVQSASDEGTSSSLLIPEFFSRLTLADLQYLRDPWGRAYLAIAQQYGQTIWGLT